ncbi:MAG: hypothetical protein JST16_02445 [Bdellovibrionales bacterium]|nr:hypothetical protein [Bdellovibrionales bacterium]
MEPVVFSSAPPASKRWDFFLGALVSLFFFIPALLALKFWLSDFRTDGLSLMFFAVLLKSLGLASVQAALSASLSVALGLFLGTGLAAGAPRVFSRLTSFLGLLVFVVPGTAMALLMLDLNAQWSWFPGQGLVAIVVAHLLMNVLFIAAQTERRIRSFWAAGALDRLEAAANLGARGWSLWSAALSDLWRRECRVWWPLVFLWSFSNFSTLLILGGAAGWVNPEVLLFHSLQNDPDSGRILFLMLTQALLGWVLFRWAARSSGALADGLNLAGANDFRLQAGFARLWRVTFPLWFLAAAPVLWMIFSPWLRGGIWSEVDWSDYLPAMAKSLFLAGLSAGFSYLLALLLLHVTSSTRRRVIGVGGVSSTLLGAFWVGAGFDLLASTNEYIELVLAAAGLALLQLPLAALWIEERLSSLPEDVAGAAMVLGCDADRCPHDLWRPLTRDIFERIVLMSFSLALAELSLTGLVVRDTELAAHLSRRLAQRYDFSGASLLLLFLTFATLAALGLRSRLRRTSSRVYG